MKEPKFKVGDVLQPVIAEDDLTKLHVIEIRTQTCAACIEQISYICRVHAKHFKSSAASIVRDLFAFNEMEVKLWEKCENGK